MKTQNQTEEINLKEGKTNTELYVQLGMIFILALVIVFNAGKIYSSSGAIGFTTEIGTVSALSSPSGAPIISTLHAVVLIFPFKSLINNFKDFVLPDDIEY